MSHELEVKYVLAVLELVGLRRATIGDSRRGHLVSRERLAEILAPHLAPRSAEILVPDLAPRPIETKPQ